MRKKFLLLKVLPFLGFVSLIYLIQNDIYLTEEIRVNNTTNTAALSTDETAHFNLFDSLTDFRNRFKTRAYSPEKANQTELFLNLNLTTFNLERYASNCKASSNASMIFVGLMSKVDSFKRRSTIRNTLLKQLNASEQKLLFFVAKSKNESINVQVDEEEIEFNDLVRLEFVEDYYNLTLKTISFLEYFNRYCNEFKYAIKLDDDVFLNWDGIESYLDQEMGNENPNIYCKVHFDSKVVRDVSNKWYVDRKDFPATTYPLYCAGPAYILNREAVNRVIQEHEKKKRKILFLEDVYTTGILTHKTSIKLNNIGQLFGEWRRWYLIKNYLKPELLIMHPVDDHSYNNMYKNIRKTYNHTN